MTTKDEIPTDLALEIGDDLEPKRFAAAIGAFFGLIEELAQMPVQGDTSPWRVKLREGSYIIALEGAPGSDNRVVNAALNRIYEGGNALVVGDFAAPVLTPKAIQHAKRLSELTKDGQHITPMKLWISKRALAYGPEIADLVRQQDKAASYNDYGTLEGILRAIYDKNNVLEIRIHDPLWPKSIPCRVSDEQIKDAIRAFRKRVEISGMIHYNSVDHPTYIKMDKLVILPDDSTLPTAGDVLGLFV